MFVVLLAGVRSVGAHTSLPAFFQLTETDQGRFDVLWRVPAVEGPAPAIYPVVPAHCAILREHTADELATATAVGASADMTCGTEGLAGHAVTIDGLARSTLEVVVKVVFADGSQLTKVLRPTEPSFVVTRPASGSRTDTAGYLVLGVNHILSGVDHLLFVLGLLFIVSGVRRLLKALTAFTVAHSLTLGLATFGVVRVSPAPVEAVVALSIVFLGVELANHRRGVEGLSYRKPWTVAFAFGLLHGLGFAGTLSQIGIPSSDIPIALLSFNLGVEMGQVGFVALVVALFYSIRPLDIRMPSWVTAAPAYSIGSLASFWFLQRCILIFVS